ncbi:MAG: glycosyltransferase [Thermoleophilaceae bacterium]
MADTPATRPRDVNVPGEPGQPPRFSFVLVSREVWPFVTGGGIGRTVHATASLLSSVGDVTVLTREAFRAEYERMAADGDPRVPAGVRFEFIRDPSGWDLGPFWSFLHCWSALVYERLCELYPGGGPDVVEFGDYGGEGFVTIQARRSGHPSMLRTQALVRLHASLEIVHALNGLVDRSIETRTAYTLERGSIAFADRLLTPGGDVLETYRRFYGAENVAPGVAVPHVLEGDDDDDATLAPPPGDGPTRLLFVGRLERRKGVDNLVQAVRELGRDDWELTLVGGDTDTAPDGGSMREHLDQLANGDARIEFADRVPHERVLELIDEHHLVVIPSIWECWSNVAREGLLRNRPLLATPTGALKDAVAQGRSGWLTRGASTAEIGEALEQVLSRREELAELVDERAPRAFLDEIVSPERTLAAYLALASEERPPPPPAEPVDVSAVVVCGAGLGPPARTLESLRDQRRPVSEVVVVSDGLDRLAPPFDTSLADAVEPLPEGTSTAALRNAGIEMARGELVLLLDAGVRLHRGFVGKAMEALAVQPSAAYATTWAEGIGLGAAPIGNFGNRVPELPGAATAALFRRGTLERHRFRETGEGCVDAEFYARLAADGMYGVVLPEALLGWAPFRSRCDDESLVESAAEEAAGGDSRMRWIAG